MRVIFIEPHLNPGIGGIRRIVEVSNHLLNRGHIISIYTPTGKPVTWLPNRVNIYPLHKLNEFESDISIFNLAEQFRVALKSNAPHKVFWVLAPEVEYKQPDIPIKALQQPFYFLANSQYMHDYIKKHSNTKQKKIEIIPGGINPTHFRHAPDMPKDHDVLYFGSQRPWKGTQIIETAIGQLNIKALKMEGLNTPQHEIYTLYNRCTCFVSAAYKEGFNFPILEAMFCGCPVVCTSDGGSGDFVKQGENALVVPRDAINIREGIKLLLKDKALRRRLIKEGLATAQQEKYTWENVTDKLERALQNLMTKPVV